MESAVKLWKALESSGTYGKFWTPSGQVLESSGQVWTFLKVSGSVWTCLAMSVVSGNIRDVRWTCQESSRFLQRVYCSPAAVTRRVCQMSTRGVRSLPVKYIIYNRIMSIHKTYAYLRDLAMPM